jgi:hypothetical protein
MLFPIGIALFSTQFRSMKLSRSSKSAGVPIDGRPAPASVAAQADAASRCEVSAFWLIKKISPVLRSFAFAANTKGQ